jgi:hypothetical protein
MDKSSGENSLMIKAIMQLEVMVVRVTGSREERYRGLRRLRTIPLRDREYRGDGEWLIRDPEKYTHIQAIRSALEDRQRQLVLPGVVG